MPVDGTSFQPGYDTCAEVTLQCPVEATLYGDYFSRGPLIFFVVAYGILVLCQLWLAFKSRAWSFSIYLGIGTIFELVGYQSRLEMVDNPWNMDPFQKQLVLLILGPTLVAAAISVTFKHLVLYYGREHSVIKPRLYPYVFVGSDLVAIIIQGAGAVLAGQGEDLSDLSSALLIGGVSFQMANMAGCGLLMLIYWKRYRAWCRDSRGSTGQEAGDDLSQVDAVDGTRVRWFVWGITAAFMLIVVRCAYRYVVARDFVIPFALAEANRGGL